MAETLEPSAAEAERMARAERRQNERIELHAGAQAAQILGQVTGDLNITPEERSEIDKLIDCKHKDQQYKKARQGTYQTSSAGILALITCCGLFAAVDELYGSESLSQVRCAHAWCVCKERTSMWFVHLGAPLPHQGLLQVEDACAEGLCLRRRLPPACLLAQPH